MLPWFMVVLQVAQTHHPTPSTTWVPCQFIFCAWAFPGFCFHFDTQHNARLPHARLRVYLPTYRFFLLLSARANGSLFHTPPPPLIAAPARLPPRRPPLPLPPRYATFCTATPHTLAACLYHLTTPPAFASPPYAAAHTRTAPHHLRCRIVLLNARFCSTAHGCRFARRCVVGAFTASTHGGMGVPRFPIRGRATIGLHAYL